MTRSKAEEELGALEKTEGHEEDYSKAEGKKPKLLLGRRGETKVKDSCFKGFQAGNHSPGTRHVFEG